MFLLKTRYGRIFFLGQSSVAGAVVNDWPRSHGLRLYFII